MSNSSHEDPNTTFGPTFLAKLLNFCEELRLEDFVITPSEIIDAAQTVSFLDISDIDTLHDGLKIALAKKPEDYAKFDRLFRMFWIKGQGRISPDIVNPLGRLVTASQEPRKIHSKTRSSYQESRLNNQAEPQGRIVAPQSLISEKTQSDKLERSMYAIYSPLETRGSKPFGASLDFRERALIKRSLRLFSRKMATRSGRRFQISSDGRIDFRKTMRASLKSGYLSDVRLSEKKISKSQLVFLVDISGSMDAYANGLVRLVYYAINTIPRTSVFGFSTEVVPLGRFLEGRNLREATDLISSHVKIWSSGTRMGSALEQMISKYPDSLSRSSVLVIVSDGWEIGDLELLRSKLEEIRKRVARIVWLNPHANSSDYRPEAAGMKVALPYVDYFAGLDVFTNRGKFLRVFGRSFHGQLVRSTNFRPPIEALTNN